LFDFVDALPYLEHLHLSQRNLLKEIPQAVGRRDACYGDNMYGLMQCTRCVRLEVFAGFGIVVELCNPQAVADLLLIRFKSEKVVTL
jgi:hypothetical protein